MSGLARLGHIARGISSGVQDYQQMQANELGLQERKQRMGLNEATIARQQQAWQREDQDREILEAARAAGARALEADRAEYDARPTEAPERALSAATNPALIESATRQQGYGLSGAEMAAKPKAPYTPSRRAILKAAQAETDELLRRGRMDLGMQRWTQVEGLRAQERGEAARSLMAAMSSGRDITKPLQEFDSLIDDGYEIDGKVKLVQQKDGSTAYEVRRKNRLTGKAEDQPMLLTQRQLVENMAAMIGKPEDAAKYSQQSLLAALKSDLDRKEKTHSTDEDIRKDNARTANDRGLIGARGAEDRKTKSTPGASNRSEMNAHVRLLQQRRLSAKDEVDSLTKRMEKSHSKDRPAIQAMLVEAQQRMADLGKEIDAYEQELRNGGKPAPGKPAGNAPPIDSFFRR